MMPLTLAAIGTSSRVVRIGGNDRMRKHLEDLGFVNGGELRVIAANAGHMIVEVCGSRIALGREMARRIMVQGGTEG